jgi:hypothetical protein
MAERITLGELMDRNFVVLGEGDDDSVRHRLDRTGDPIAVMVDHAGEVSGLWSGEGRGTAIIASPNTPAEDIAGSGTLLREMNRAGTAIVVVSDVQPVGVVSVTSFAQYLAVELGLQFSTLSEAAVGDAGLGGDYIPGQLVIVCKVCGTRNVRRSWVEGVALCANPAPPQHILVRR